MMAEWNPSDKGAQFERHYKRWQLELDVSEMTLDVLDKGTYLPKFSAGESGNDYAYRKRMSVPLDMCRDAVRIRMDNIWRADVQRDAADSPHRDLIERLIHDADGDGTSLDSFMRRAAWNHYVTGCDIVTQVTAAPAGTEVATRADEQAAGIRPYWLQFTPLDRYDWAVKGSRNFLWARYCLGEVARPDEQGGGDQTTTEYLTLTPTKWRKHTVVVQRAGGIPVINSTDGTHPLGQPPIVKFYFAESEKGGAGGVPLSLLTRPAIVARVAMEIKSQADADLLAAVTRWFVSGAGSDELPTVYAPALLIKFGSETAKIAVVQGDVGHIREKRDWLLLYLGEILRLLKFRGGMAEIEAQAGSGLKLAIERTDLDNELRATASQLEAVELEMMRQAVVLATGKQIERHDAGEALKYKVHYNRDFVLEPLNKMLENIKLYAQDSAFVAEDVPSILREMLRQAGGMLVRPDTPQADEMAAEIEAITVKPAEGEGSAPEGAGTET